MTEPRAPMVRVRGLEKRFFKARRLRELLRPWRPRSAIKALSGVDLDVHRGELVALIGPNGAGKTTLLEVVADLVEPDAGEVWVDGVPLRQGRRIRSRVGYVLADERSFWIRLRVLDNLRFFAALEGLQGALAHRRIEDLAALLGLTHLLDRRFAELSRGQKQRVGIARGLLPDPPVLLFDEATRALDPGRARRFRRLVREVLVDKEKKAVLFATHQLDEAEELADRAALMIEGRISALGPWSTVQGAAEEAFMREVDREDVALAQLLEGS